MKKHITMLAAAAAIFAIPATAQETAPGKPKPVTRKGNITIGSGIGLANIAFGRNNNGAGSVNTYDVLLTPNVGYFVSDHLLLSGSLAGGAAANINEFSYRYRNFNSGIGVGARYYFGKAVNTKGEINKLRFYAEAGAMYFRNWERTKFENGTHSDYSYHDVAIHGGAGLSYFLNPNAAFETGIRYNRNLEIEQSSYAPGSIQLHLGMRFFLNRK